MNIPPLQKTYDGRRVLDFPGACFEKGRVYALIGANGSGKSTLARLLCGIISPDGGGFSPPCSVGYMPQNSFAFHMSVRANILMNAPHGRRDSVRAGELMEALGIGSLAASPAAGLSGGETARMALARLLMRDYEMLILDEPTAAMDVQSTVMAEKLISEYAARTGCCVLLVTHSLKQARRLAAQVLFLHNGRLDASGAPDALFSSPGSSALKQFIEYYDA